MEQSRMLFLWFWHLMWARTLKLDESRITSEQYTDSSVTDVRFSVPIYEVKLVLVIWLTCSCKQPLPVLVMTLTCFCNSTCESYLTCLYKWSPSHLRWAILFSEVHYSIIIAQAKVRSQKMLHLHTQTFPFSPSYTSSHPHAHLPMPTSLQMWHSLSTNWHMLVASYRAQAEHSGGGRKWAPLPLRVCLRPRT